MACRAIFADDLSSVRSLQTDWSATVRSTPTITELDGHKWLTTDGLSDAITFEVGLNPLQGTINIWCRPDLASSNTKTEYFFDTTNDGRYLFFRTSAGDTHQLYVGGSLGLFWN